MLIHENASADALRLEAAVRGVWGGILHQWGAARVLENPPFDKLRVSRQQSPFLPRCLDLITADEAIRRIQLYFDGGTVRFLDDRERAACAETISGAVIEN